MGTIPTGKPTGQLLGAVLAADDSLVGKVGATFIYFPSFFNKQTLLAIRDTALQLLMYSLVDTNAHF